MPQTREQPICPLCGISFVPGSSAVALPTAVFISVLARTLSIGEVEHLITDIGEGEIAHGVTLICDQHPEFLQDGPRPQ